MSSPPSTEPSRGAPAAPPLNKWVVTLAITFGTLMATIDTSIVNVAIPHMRGALGASIDEITWVSTAYIVAMVVMMPLTAWLGRRLGRKNVYQACMALFLLGSFFCGTARSLPELIVFRALQGLGAGGLGPTEQAILRETFPLEEQALAMSIFGLAVMVGPAIGPTLGGWIVDNYSWPWIFFVNLPVGIVGLGMVQRFVRDPDFLVHARKAARGERIDTSGIVLLAVGLSALQLLLERGDRESWFASPFIVALAAASAIALLFFVYRELTIEHPVVDLSILRYRSYWAGNFIGAVLGVALFGSMFLLPVFFQELLGLSALQSGLELMPRTLVMVLTMPIAGLLFNRIGARVMIGVGLFIGGAAAWAMARFTLDSSMADLVWPQIVQGFGFSLIFVALSTTSLSPIPKEKMSAATGLYNLIRNLGGSIGTVTVAVLLERYQATSRTALAADLQPIRPLAQQRLASIHRFLEMRTGHASSSTVLQVLGFTVQRQAALLAFERVFAVIGIIFFVSIPLVFLLENVRPGKRAQRGAAREPVPVLE